MADEVVPVVFFHLKVLLLLQSYVGPSKSIIYFSLKSWMTFLFESIPMVDSKSRRTCFCSLYHTAVVSAFLLMKCTHCDILQEVF